MNTVAVWTLIALGVVVAIADGYLLLHGPVGSSISAKVSALSRQYPALPFAAGCLCAHLFGF